MKLSFVLSALGGAALLGLACSDEPSAPPPAADAGPDAALEDAGAPDSATPDARPPFDPADEPVVCAATPCFTQLVAGDLHFCALGSDGAVRCWGDDERGQLGTPGALAGVVQISAAGRTTCARAADGAVSCWGDDAYGQLGRGLVDEDPHRAPVRIAVDAAARVDVGQRTACTTSATGAVTCWGNDENAQLGRGEPSPDPGAPAPAVAGVVATRTAAGLDTAFALRADGALVSWGAVAGPRGTLAGRVASVTPSPIPDAVQGLGPVSGLAVSGATPGRIPPNTIPGSPLPPPNEHACVVVGGAVACWGKSERGAFGVGLPDAVLAQPTPANLGTRAYAQQVAAGGETTCARFTDGSVRCTGENERGQLGAGAAGPFASTFTPATTLAGRAVSVAVSREAVCALVQGGTVSCWGSNAHGELGRGARDDDPHPSAAPLALEETRR